MITRDPRSSKARTKSRGESRASGSAASRFKRPAPLRERPLRRVSLAFGASAGAGEAKSADPGVLERAVGLAYRVCDEYMRGGQSAAAALRPDSSRTKATMPDETTTPMAMIMTMWTQMGRMWLGAMMPYMGAVGQGTDIFGNPLGDPGAAPPTTASGPVPVDVTVKVSSTRPVVVQIRILDRARTTDLTIGALEHIEGADRGALTSVYLEELRHGVSVNVTVPREQPAATYRGAFTDAITREVRGTLTITVSDPV